MEEQTQEYWLIYFCVVAWVRFLKIFSRKLDISPIWKANWKSEHRRNRWADHGNGKTSRAWRESSRKIATREQKSESEAIILPLGLFPRVPSCSAKREKGPPRYCDWKPVPAVTRWLGYCKPNNHPGLFIKALGFHTLLLRMPGSIVFYEKKKSEYMVSRLWIYWWRALCRNSIIWTLQLTRSNYLDYMCWQVAATVYLQSKTDKENFKNIWH